ncbi:MAG: hypothetical protein ABL974_18930, partial [Prosthecobacter sp.]
MKRASPSLAFFRTPSLWRELLVVVQVALTLLMPCYAGIPDWWNRSHHTAFYQKPESLSQKIGTARDWNAAEVRAGRFSLRLSFLLRCEILCLGTAKVTTAADGLKSVRFTQYFSHSSLPRCLYYVYEQAQGGTPVITYYDRYHTPLLVEKTGFNGETIFQESTTKFLFDNGDTYLGAQKLGTQPYFAHDPPPPYGIEEQDVYGRKVRVTSADGSQSAVEYQGLKSFSYTLRGGANDAANTRRRTHTRVVDQAERPLEIEDNVGSKVAFTYAADGQPLSATTSYVGTDSAITSAATTITTTYNAQRLKESVTDPNVGTSFTFYDSFGRAVLTRDALGKGTATSFDLLGRPARTLTGISVPATAEGPQTITSWISGLSTATEGETETVYTYDTAPGYGLGKAASVTFKEFERDGSGAITATRQVVESYVYDSLGRSVSGSTTLSGQVAFNGTYNVSTSYDGLGRVSTVTDAGEYTRASVYNERGFLSEVHEFSAGGAMLWRGMSYDASGKMLLEHNGNGIGTQNRYHPTRGFLESSRTLRWTTNATVQEYEMQLDDLGNVLWRREQRFEEASPITRTESFGYDKINRLTYSSVTGQSTQAFTFAANGNIQTKIGIGDYGYGARGHGPHAVTSVTVGTAVQRSYSYDAKGRMTTEHVGSDLTTLPLREIAYTSFDQPRFIQHWGAAALSSDVGALDDGTTPWDQICTLRFYFGPGMQRLIQTKHKGQLVTKVLSLGGFEIRETTNGASLTGTMIEREERSSFGNGTRVKRWTVTNPNTPVISYEFAAKDHLGSDTA